MGETTRPTGGPTGGPTAVLLAALALGVTAMPAAAQGRAALRPVPLQGVDDAQALIALAQPETLGNADAEFRIIEFGDYQCPGCGAFATAVKPRVEREYVDTGLAQLVFHDFPLTGIHPNAFVAARAARCAADQDRFWAYHDRLFENQSQWSGRPGPIGAFVEYATELGLDETAFEDCVRSDAHAVLVTANLRLAEQIGINETPTILVSGGGSVQRVAPTFEALKAHFDRLLDGAANEPR